MAVKQKTSVAIALGLPEHRRLLMHVQTNHQLEKYVSLAGPHYCCRQSFAQRNDHPKSNLGAIGDTGGSTFLVRYAREEQVN
jgi:hypothetical protein